VSEVSVVFTDRFVCLNLLRVLQMTVVQLTLHRLYNCVWLTAERLTLRLLGQAARILEVCKIFSTENFTALYGTHLTPLAL
jgi:hypothetical protein